MCEKTKCSFIGYIINLYVFCTPILLYKLLGMTICPHQIVFSNKLQAILTIIDQID